MVTIWLIRHRPGFFMMRVLVMVCHVVGPFSLLFSEVDPPEEEAKTQRQ